MTDNNFPITLDAPGAPVLMWARPDEVEESALDQLKNVAQLPGLYGLRVMPDVHWGNGATVGSVIAMEQALAPAAVGIEARTDEGVLDEITYAYKDLDSVIAAESDLVEVVQKLDTILCVKG